MPDVHWAGHAPDDLQPIITRLELRGYDADGRDLGAIVLTNARLPEPLDVRRGEAHQPLRFADRPDVLHSREDIRVNIELRADQIEFIWPDPDSSARWRVPEEQT